MVRLIGVPGLGDVDFTVGGPGKWFVGEQPEGGPYTRCTGT